MTNVKLMGLLAVVLILLSCVLALPLTRSAGFANLPVADQSLLPFPTPTPLPTPTPEPTPTPTPVPEPTAKPTVTVDCKSTTATASNLKVEVTGALTYNDTALYGVPVYVGFSADGGNNWENFSLVRTQADGSYAAVWTPNATGNYLIIAQWQGNLSLHWMNATVGLAMTSDSAGNAFSVASNSTISNFAYDSTTQQLSFNTNDTSNTAGYAHVCIPKTLLSDAQTLQVTLDGTAVSFTSESKGDVWVISCVYTKGQHVFNVQIPFMQILSQPATPWVAIVIIIAVLIALIAVTVVIRRRRKTAKLVASILSQNRPTY